jgi:hypothetical protein
MGTERGVARRAGCNDRQVEHIRTCLRLPSDKRDAALEPVPHARSEGVGGLHVGQDRDVDIAGFTLDGVSGAMTL